MNQLSWLIYLADVCGSVGAWFDWIAGISGFIMLVTIIVAIVASSNTNNSGTGEIWHAAARILYWAVPIFLGFLLLGVITPNRTTIYAIAASEMGEEIVSSPTVGRATRALEAWIEDQLPDPPREPRETNNSGED